MTTDFSRVTFNAADFTSAESLRSSEYKSYDANPDGALQNDDFKGDDQAKVLFVYRLIKTSDPSDDLSTFRGGMTEVFRTQEVRPILKKIKETPEIWSLLTNDEQNGEQKKVNAWLDTIFLGDRVVAGFGAEPQVGWTQTAYRFDMRDAGSVYRQNVDVTGFSLIPQTSGSLDAERTYGRWMVHGVLSATYNPSWNTQETHVVEVLDGETITDETDEDTGWAQNLLLTPSVTLTRGSRYKVWGNASPQFYLAPPADSPESSFATNGGAEVREINFGESLQGSLSGSVNYSTEQYTPPPAIIEGAATQSSESFSATVSPGLAVGKRNAISVDGTVTNSEEEEYYSNTESKSKSVAAAYQFTRKLGQSLRVSTGAQTTDSSSVRTDIDETYRTSEDAAEVVGVLRTPILHKLSGTFTLAEAYNYSTGNLEGGYFSGEQQIALEWTPFKKMVTSLSVAHGGHDWSLWYTPEVGSGYPEGEYTQGSQTYAVTASTQWTPDSWTISTELSLSRQDQDGTFFPTNETSQFAKCVVQKKLGDRPRTVVYGYGYYSDKASEDQFSPGAEQSAAYYGGGLGVSVSSIKLWTE